MPILFKRVRELRNYLDSVRCDRGKNKLVGFVPTMGYLHEGHIELIKRSKLQNDITVVSIYVNPTQFGENEDYDRYPRDIDRDLAICNEHGVDVVFVPDDKEIYPNGFQTVVMVEGLSEILEGKFRPGHFKGVTTVVTKLINAVMPDRLYLGEKDFQQMVIIKRMVEDLLLPVEIVPVPIVRDKDGLALSSRNTYLSEDERKSATAIYKSLLLAKEMVSNGEKRMDIIRKRMEEFLKSHPHIKKIDYIEACDNQLNIKEEVSKGDRILIAVWVGNTRLIDNMEL